jgi:hypothetical protein
MNTRASRPRSEAGEKMAISGGSDPVITSQGPVAMTFIVNCLKITGFAG